MTPQIVTELRRENAALRAEVARWKRQEALVAAVGRSRIAWLEAGLRSMAFPGRKKHVARILAAPVVIPSLREVEQYDGGAR